MYVRKRGLFYHYEFFVEGRRYSGCFNGKAGKPIAKDKTEARELVYKERRKVLDGTYRADCEREELKDFVTFTDKVYLPFARAQHSSHAHAEFRCEVLKEHFKGRRFDEITVMTVIGYINRRLKSETVRRRVTEDGTVIVGKRSPTTVNKEVTLLSSIFAMAMAEKVATANPCKDLPKSVRAKIPARRKRSRRLFPEEERALYDVGFVGRRKHLRPPAEVALYTGMRKGELFGLKREHVHLGGVPLTRVIVGEVWEVRPGWLLIEKSKSGRPRLVPMSKRARAILKVLCEEETPGEYVFRSVRAGSRINDVKKGFVSACLAAGVRNLVFHDLRHTWSSRAAEMGVPEHVRRDILGHSSRSMTADYTHASPDEMERAMELVANFTGWSVSDLGTISANGEAAAEPLSAAAS